MMGDADSAGMVADAERRGAMEQTEARFIYGSGFALVLTSEGGATGRVAGSPNLPEILDEGLDDANGKTSECG